MIGITATAAIAVTPRTAVPVTTATAAATVAARTTTVATITPRLARFARRTGVFQLLAGFLVDDAHRQANLAAIVDLQHLDLHFL
ncbi:MAG: hypothetical protein KDE25_00380, partial [Novosphingobium sp.]|nr:hypothetical protein [Novosphingobium sp.]